MNCLNKTSSKTLDELRQRQSILSESLKSMNSRSYKILSTVNGHFFENSVENVVAAKKHKNFLLTGEVQDTPSQGRMTVSVKNSINIEMQSNAKKGFNLRQSPFRADNKHSIINGNSQLKASYGLTSSLKPDVFQKSLLESIHGYVDKIKQKSVDKKKQVLEVEKVLCTLKKNIFSIEGKNEELRKETHKIRGKMANYEHYKSSRDILDRKITKMTEKIKSNDLSEKFFKIKLENEAIQKEKLEDILYEVCVSLKENSSNIDIKKLVFMIKSLKNQLRIKPTSH
jgi:hypothetical protein